MNEINKMQRNIRYNNKNYNPSSDDIINIQDLKRLNDEGFHKNRIPSERQYQPVLSIVFSNGTTLNASNFLKILRYDIDLTKYVFPLFSVLLDIPQQYIPLIQFDDDLTFVLKILSNSSDTENPYDYETDFQVNLKKIKQNDSPVNINTLNVYENVSTEVVKQNLELKLIPEECLRMNKKLFSGVYQDCTINDMVIALTKKLEVDTYFENSKNQRTFDQMILLPNNIFYNLKFINDFYGIYESGLCMFYGFNRLYIQSKSNFLYTNGLNKANINFSGNDPEISTESYLSTSMTKVKDDNVFIIPSNYVSVLNSKYYLKEALGDNIFYMSDETTKENPFLRNIKTENSSKTKTYYNNYNNTLAEKEIENKLNNNNISVELILTGLMIDSDSLFKGWENNF